TVQKLGGYISGTHNTGVIVFIGVQKSRPYGVFGVTSIRGIGGTVTTWEGRVVDGNIGNPSDNVLDLGPAPSFGLVAPLTRNYGKGLPDLYFFMDRMFRVQS